MIYICWITQNDTTYDKAYQYAGCMELFFGQGEFNKIFLQSYGRLPAEAANEEEGQTGLCLRWCGLWPFLFWSKNAMLFFVKCSMQWLLQAFGAPTKGEFRWKRIRVVCPATVADLQTKTSKAICWQLLESSFFLRDRLMWVYLQ